ncbi:hypothetical protein Fmac_015218 [Flemingia macrophylla]|uniref:DUF7745 domain-containing protein n=1 Tax=Flemingia macrophylla TaxID=520843 RepID=A0ABD1MDY0_9FABA
MAGHGKGLRCLQTVVRNHHSRDLNLVIIECEYSGMSELFIMEGSNDMHRQLKKVDILSDRVERIEHICALISHEAHTDFEKSYSRILDLLKIYVDPAFMRIFVHFWNPNLHCFEFPQFDLIPTLEEYELMLKWPKSVRAYTFQGDHIVVDKVVNLVKLPFHQAALIGNRNIKGWKLKIPLPAILADTLLSVDFCHQKQGKTLRCCSKLLYVWGITHFYAFSHMGALPDPLRIFLKTPLRRRYALEWQTEVEHWSIDHFFWICPWFRPCNVLIRCGNYPSIPLMGLRGCMAYSPKLAMRQLMRTQTIPSQKDLGGLRFFYDYDHQDEMHTIYRAWEKPIFVGDGELGKARVSVSSDYEEWRRRRGVSQPSTSHAPTSADRELQDKVEALTKTLEIMGAQLRALEDKDEESSLIIDGLQRQCKKKDQEIGLLKDECANINEKAIRATKMLKVNPNSQLQEVTEKIAHLEAEHTKQAKLIKIMQEDLTLT